MKKRARQVLKASINLVQLHWGKLGRRKHSTTSIHIYEIRPRADKHGFDLSGDSPPTVRCGILGRMQLGTQSALRSSTAAHVTL